MPIEPGSMVVRAENLMSTPIDDELVILNMDRNNYMGLDDIGRRVWDLLAEPRRMDDLCNRLSLEYEATPEQIASDLLPFLEELRDEGLIRLIA
ncbi:MAG TPA: PqqD family protein [Geobacteraceae bacterium]